MASGKRTPADPRVGSRHAHPGRDPARWTRDEQPFGGKPRLQAPDLGDEGGRDSLAAGLPQLQEARGFQEPKRTRRRDREQRLARNRARHDRRRHGRRPQRPQRSGLLALAQVHRQRLEGLGGAPGRGQDPDRSEEGEGREGPGAVEGHSGEHVGARLRKQSGQRQESRRCDQHYRLNAQCFVGRPAAPGKTVMQYFLSQGRPPQGAFAGETATRFTLPTLTVLRLGGNWQLMDMDPATPVTSLLNFGANKSDAWKAFETIARYRFGYRCRVGTLNQMMYFRR